MPASKGFSFLVRRRRHGATIGATAALSLLALSYVGSWIAGWTALPDLLQGPLLAALPGPIFGFVIDALQHLGKVTEETGIAVAIVIAGTGLGALLSLTSKRHRPPTDIGRRRLLQIAPVAIAGVALAVTSARLVPEWWLALRPPEGGTGEVPAITPTSSFYMVSKNFSDPVVVAVGWRLTIGGLVDRGRTLTYEDLRDMSQAAEVVTLECVSNPVGGRLMSTGRFEGPRLIDLLSAAGRQASAKYATFKSADGYTESLPLSEIGPEVLVAITLNGSPLPNEHGFPARLVVPGRYGMKQPKWLESVELASDPVAGYYEAKGWTDSALVKTTARIDAPSDGDRVSRRSVDLAGVAFAGTRGISMVEWSSDEGATWSTAQLEPMLSQYAWRQWRARWQPDTSGHRVLMVRAHDGTDRLQESMPTSSFPDGSAGLHSTQVTVA